MAELDRRLEQLRAAALPAPRRINREWIEDQLQTLRKSVARDSVGARREIQKHRILLIVRDDEIETLQLDPPNSSAPHPAGGGWLLHSTTGFLLDRGSLTVHRDLRAGRWRLTCSCGRWRGFTETDVDAHRLAASMSARRARTSSRSKAATTTDAEG